MVTFKNCCFSFFCSFSWGQEGRTFGLVKPAVTRAYWGQQDGYRTYINQAPPCARPAAKCFTHPPMVPQLILGSCCYSHFTEEETGLREGGDLPRSLGWESLKPESFCTEPISHEAPFGPCWGCLSLLSQVEAEPLA